MEILLLQTSECWSYSGHGHAQLKLSFLYTGVQASDLLKLLALSPFRWHFCGKVLLIGTQKSDPIIIPPKACACGVPAVCQALCWVLSLSLARLTLAWNSFELQNSSWFFSLFFFHASDIWHFCYMAMVVLPDISCIWGLINANSQPKETEWVKPRGRVWPVC